MSDISRVTVNSTTYTVSDDIARKISLAIAGASSKIQKVTATNQMSDQSKLYVYNNHVYYHDGSVWQDSQVNYGLIDDGLSTAGSAADASATGTKIVNTRKMTAPLYSASSTYAVGDIVNYGEKIYKCNTAIGTAEAWTASHWTELNSLSKELTSEITNLKSDLSDIDAEVIDIRVGANGKTYASAGDAVRGQITDLSEPDTTLTSDDMTVFYGYFEVGNKVMVEASYVRMVYAPIDGTKANKATVSKTLGKLFRVGFTNVLPEAEVSIIDEAGTYIDAGQVTSTTVDVPDTAKYICAVIWNANTDASTTSADDMIASVTMKISHGAKDNTARSEIENTNTKIEEIKNDLLNIPPDNINKIIRTGWNYLTDAIVKETGNYWNGATVGQPLSLAANPSYNAVMIEAESAVYNFTPVRYLHALDADKKLLQVITTDGTFTFDNQLLEASYLCFTFHASGFDTAFISKYGTPAYEQYTVEGQWVFEDLIANPDDTTIDAKNIYLPSKVYCGVGRTIELYNEQVLLTADKYHINWNCDVGVAYKRKFSITGTNADIGTHALIFNVYDDKYNVIATKTASLIIGANSIDSALKVLPIGDSLTNGKEWLSEVPELSNSKIEFIGTRSLSGVVSEGRSGASTSWYLANSSYTYADGSTYVGNPNVTGSSNPFWDGFKFSLNHYITEQSAYVGTPDAVLIMLGTNDLKQTDTVTANIKTMVDTIHTEYPTMPVFVCNAIFHSNQNGYYSTGGEGYVGVMSNWQYELDRYTIALMHALASTFDNETYSGFVTIVPVASCMDRENNFGQVSVPVNPRLSNVTELIPSQYTHPQSAGYLQMADVIYSACCCKLT